MKLNKLLVAGLLASIATSAFAADVNLHFTGSTAFRTGAVNGITDWLTSNSATGVKIVYTSGSTLVGATQQGFYGVVGGKSYFISCSWTGSVGGVNSVALKTPSQVTGFYTESAVTTNGNSTGLALATSGNTESAFADGAFADCSQAETGLVGSLYNNVVSEPVGVIPFVWVRGKNVNAAEQAALNNVTNITSLQARAALTGYIPLSQFTKNPADAALTVAVIGRDNSSGTRVNTFVESGFGRDNAPLQYTYTIDGGSGQIVALSENVDTNGGYGSGGNIGTGVTAPVADTGLGFVVLGYMGISDAAKLSGITFNATTGVFSGSTAAQVLSYDGVTYSHDAVKYGAYPFWNYENMLRRPGLTGDALTAYNAIRDKIKTADAGTAGIKLNDMHVSRSAAGTIIY